MGKNQHSKDRLFVTRTEHETLYGGRRAQVAPSAATVAAQSLPLDCCALSLRRFVNPVMAPDGSVFEVTAVVPYLRKHGNLHPITGEALRTEDLVPAKFDRDEKGRLRCPVLFKHLGPTVKVVCVKTTGNVYSYEAIDKLNLKPKFMCDLLTGAPFKKDDLVVIQDPSRTRKTATGSENVKHKEKGTELQKDKEKKGAINMSGMAERVMAQVGKEDLGFYLSSSRPSVKRKRSGEVLSHRYSIGEAAMGLTSTSCAPVITNSYRPSTSTELREATSKKIPRGTKSYVRIKTTLGNLEVELHCDLTPAACHNFLLLAAEGSYDGVPFHHIIPGLVVARCGNLGVKSALNEGKHFKNEIRRRLKHQRGSLAVVNSGGDSNQSQFYISFTKQESLNGRHTIFGLVVGGFEVLDALESAESGSVSVIGMDILKNSFENISPEQKNKRKRLGAR